MKIDGSVFVVTGASSGLGAATARMVAENGGRVLLADVNAEAGGRLEAELAGAALFARTDVTDEASA